MDRFTETGHCNLRIHCKTCRTSPEWRQNIMSQFEWDGECPHGITIENIPTQKMPPVTEQILNLTQAVGRAFKALVTGEQVVADEATRKARIEICESCDQLSDTRCAKCGCYTAKKITLQTEKCPIGNW
jgi:hypothetical protein